MNGSDMLIRSDIEQSVGWDFPGLMYSEDTRFAYEAYKRHGSIFGWHGGITIEQPPASVRTIIKQRKRWFWGGLLQLPHAPKRVLPERIYRSVSWFLGFVLISLFPFWIVLDILGDPLFPRGILVATSGILWFARPQIGFFLNESRGSMPTHKKILYAIALFITTPITTFMSSVSTALALLSPPEEFEITDKEAII
jgi:cellulose synthase/poly-beta-1,6-N-acetylglucosamine synthase-like glycosyltransferase